MLERDIEKKLVSEVTKRGGMVIKQNGLDGIPDRLILAPLGLCAFVELKAPGKKPRKLQSHRKKQIETLGFDVYVVDSVEGIQELIRRLF
ncbi:VRR-NUC domain-containing protein [Cellulosilyticum sp. WCF-2]|uniref:VRR-NUC domain-containing protein n=1 Tax=Cellulosilyticum sp. WCF-2 TaxID=2497860 RepID=UPI000F8F1068|nr:VRR-NUC domain-containing protein [Cellulosilyticum sp. WCF-2]QEH70992.1 VRR-NUC domain-containing protein [Cellulosilyticum sp. WCF-2]